MAENYRHLYEQMKKMVTMYQDEIVPGLRKVIADLESQRPKGRWEPIVDMVWNLDTPVLQGWRCSECGREEQFKEPYCNCGAKMEE